METLKTAWERFKDQCEDGDGYTEDTFIRLESQILRAIEAQDTPPRLKIKPLEWEDYVLGLEGQYARTPFGNYAVYKKPGEPWTVQLLTRKERCEGLADGKLKAEAHWPQKIGECLV